jgi:hypothetical protein
MAKGFLLLYLHRPRGNRLRRGLAERFAEPARPAEFFTRRLGIVRFLRERALHGVFRNHHALKPLTKQSGADYLTHLINNQCSSIK